MKKYNDYPITECAEQANARIQAAKVPTRVYQKWTCHHCNSRQTMEQPNSFFLSGTCEECKRVTNITHCNYMLVMGADPPTTKRNNESDPNLS